MSVKNHGLRRIKSFERSGSAVRFSIEADGVDATVELSIPAARIIRYKILPVEESPTERFDLLDPEWLPGEDAPSIDDNDERIILEAYGTKVEVTRDPWTVIVRDQNGRPAFYEYPLDIDARGEPQSNPSGFGLSGNEAATSRVTFGLDPEESLFGLGEKFTSIDKRGQRIVAWNRNPYGTPNELAYKNIPFMVSSRGYGLFLNDSGRSTWSLGSESNAAGTVEVEGPGLDLFIIIDSNMKGVLDGYADLTGHAPLPARWSFGVWMSPAGEHVMGDPVHQESLLALADELRSRKIPSDVLHLDPLWMRDKHYCDFEWDREWFPDPEAMIATLKEKGFKLCLWEHPYIDVRSDMYREGKEKGYFIKRADGSVYDQELVIKPMRISTWGEEGERQYDLGGIVDFSNPDAAKWYAEKHRPLLEMGVAVFKTDFGEEIPEDGVYASGKTGAEMHNAYPLLYNDAIFDITKEFSDKPLVWGRSSFAGIQRYPLRWSGDPVADFPSFALSLRGGLSYGMSGDPFWSVDLGGFRGDPGSELYVRWVQCGMLLSHTRFHGMSLRMPWNRGEEVLAIVKRYSDLRYQLLPYIYGTSLESTRTNVPVMRPLGLEFEDDPGSLAIQTEYLLGQSILVAPVLSAGGYVNVYLPPGDWYDLWTGEKKQGASTYRMKVDLDHMPVYIRANAIIPTAEVSDSVPDMWDRLTFDIYPQADGMFEIPEENGLASTTIRVSGGGAKEVVANGPERTWDFVFRDVDEPEEVSIDLDGSNSEGSWKYDSSSHNLEVHAERCVSVRMKIVE
jgi:alpha-D-xyloside xylohydrolase